MLDRRSGVSALGRRDRLITRWLKRHLQRLGAEVDLERIHSLVEDQSMLAENLEHWARREREAGHLEGRLEGEQIGIEKGEYIGAEKTRLETARNLLKPACSVMRRLRR